VTLSVYSLREKSISLFVGIGILANLPEATAEYHPPRWLLLSTAIGCAIAYAVIFAGGNIFMIKMEVLSQQYGWPFTYMTRDSFNLSNKHLFYDSWPLDNPPIVQFDAFLLCLNIICGIILTFIAAMLPIYWLRTRGRPFSYSLGSLFEIMTIGICLAGLASFFRRCNTYECGLLDFVKFFLFLCTKLIYVVPCGSVLLVAHWAVTKNNGRRQRLFGLHWLTWLAMFAPIVLPFYYYSWQIEGLFSIHLNNPDNFDRIFPKAVTEVWLISIAATGFVVETWIRRRERRLPMRRHVVLAAVGVLVAMIILSDTLWMSKPIFHSCFWSIAAAIYAAEILTVDGLRLAWRKLIAVGQEPRT
jgi:hypothetical protein